MDLSANRIRCAEPRPLSEPPVDKARRPLFLFIIQKLPSEKVLGGSQLLLLQGQDLALQDIVANQHGINTLFIQNNNNNNSNTFCWWWCCFLISLFHAVSSQ